jgi:monoamine oxidase
VGLTAAVSKPRYSSVDGGFQRVPLELARRARAAGATVEFGQELIAVSATQDGVRLQLRSGKGGVRQVEASRAILAVPTSTLRELVARSPTLAASGALVHALAHISDIEGLKAYLSYQEPWWRRLGLRPGRSTSDGPLRQTFYLPPQGDGRSLILAGYAFGDDAANYWGGLAPDTGASGPTTINPEFMAELTRQLSLLHGVEVPDPVAGRAHWWGVASGSAVPIWREGVRPWEIAPGVRQPIAGVPLFACGDSMSLNQGWAVGAAQTAELVLREHFGLRRPAWMSPDTPLGA